MDDQRLEGATLTAFGKPVDLLEGMPRGRDPFCWLDSDHPEKAHLIDMALEKGKQAEKALEEVA